ncbi:MAG: response regulator transcription factor [Actinomycetia bacterium]|nr:response regulator transcription factor [Actinomycetes bacterium]
MRRRSRTSVTYRGRVRLVLVDNDEGALELIHLDLGLEGHEIVATALDGEGAVTACAATRPDVLVVDYRMPPGIDGVEVARRVLAAGTVGGVVLYSNYVDPRVVAEAEALGARWLVKGDLVLLRAAVLASGHDRPPGSGG